MSVFAGPPLNAGHCSPSPDLTLPKVREGVFREPIIDFEWVSFAPIHSGATSGLYYLM